MQLKVPHNLKGIFLRRRPDPSSQPISLPAALRRRPLAILRPLEGAQQRAYAGPLPVLGRAPPAEGGGQGLQPVLGANAHPHARTGAQRGAAGAARR